MTITATAPRASAYRGRLRWWTELPLIAVVYGLYTAGRLFVRGDVDTALGHGIDVLHIEQALDLDPERWLNTLFTRYHALGIPSTAMWRDTIDRPHHVYHGEPIAGLI